jgi:hypothetical protein
VPCRCNSCTGFFGSGVNLARVGPTTPTRARRPFDASVDPTDARNGMANGAHCPLAVMAGEMIGTGRVWAKVARVGRRTEAVEPLAFCISEKPDGHGGLLWGATPQGADRQRIANLFPPAHRLPFVGSNRQRIA